MGEEERGREMIGEEGRRVEMEDEGSGLTMRCWDMR